MKAIDLTPMRATINVDSSYSVEDQEKLKAAEAAGELAHKPSREFPIAGMFLGLDNRIHRQAFFASEEAAAAFFTGCVGDTVIIGAVNVVTLAQPPAPGDEADGEGAAPAPIATDDSPPSDGN